MNTAAVVLEIRESRTKAVSRDVYRSLEDSSDFVGLLDAGVVSLVRSRTTPYGLKANPFVGEAVLEDGTRIVLQEKVEGTLAALLEWALPTDVRIAESPSVVGAGEVWIEVLCRRFLDALAESMRYGRLKRYARQPEIAPLLRGRLDIRRSFRLQATGRRNLLAYERTELSADVLVNRLLAVGLRAVEAFASVRQSSMALATKSREWSILFSDIPTDRIWRAERRAQHGLFTQALQDPEVQGSLRRAVAYAQALVLHLGARAKPEDSEVVPESFFLDLSTLFEDAVRGALADLAESGLVQRGLDLDEHVLVDRSDHYRAEPDFVIDSPGGRIVGDCKYKTDPLPSHPDLYQLLAHMRALEGNLALLVSPGDTPAISKVGTTADGVEVWKLEVRPRWLATDLLDVSRRTEAPFLLRQVVARNAASTAA